MRVVKVDEGRCLALCSGPEGEHSSVEIALVQPVATGELLLVHAGTALGRAEGKSRPRGAIEPRASHPTTINSTAIEPTAIEPTAIEPTAIEPGGREIRA